MAERIERAGNAMLLGISAITIQSPDGTFQKLIASTDMSLLQKILRWWFRKTGAFIVNAELVLSLVNGRIGSIIKGTFVDLSTNLYSELEVAKTACSFPEGTD